LNANYVRALAVAGVALLAACSGGSMNQAIPGTMSQGNSGTMSGNVLGSMGAPGSRVINLEPNTRAACDTIPTIGSARCFALIRTDIAPALRGAAPAGFGPTDLQSAYSLPSSTGGKGQIVGIVDAYDDPNAEKDLGVYRSTFGLPACTTKNKCFKKVSQTGTKKYPSPNPGWAGEISLDLDMASAVCPNCKIVLVEATSNYFSDLGKSVDEAVKLNANVVSNSYGGGEAGGTNKAYTHPGHIITASSGDGGYGAQSPCSYATVVCVGGTTLIKTTKGRGWNEISWAGAGSGCSAVVKKPKWQHDKGCTMRSESDVSAVANPATGVAVYDTYQAPGWQVYGGTSVASPLIGAVFALAGNANTQKFASEIWAAGGGTSLNDVTAGPPNGSCPSQYKYICTPGPGYDGVTGWGTPNGVGAF
jgi:hypothetical protein